MTPRITYSHLMLATAAKAPFAAPGWIFELKYDGLRVLASRRGQRVRLESSRGRDMAPSFPELVDALRAIPHELILDGELVVCDGRGRPQFERLARRARISKEESVRTGAIEDPAAVFAFDLLWLDGRDYRNFPLVIRKGMLRYVLRQSQRIIYASHFENSAAELWALARKFKLEGVVAKDASSLYTAGRTDRWVTIRTATGAVQRRVGSG